VPPPFQGERAVFRLDRLLVEMASKVIWESHWQGRAGRRPWPPWQCSMSGPMPGKSRGKLFHAAHLCQARGSGRELEAPPLRKKCCSSSEGAVVYRDLFGRSPDRLRPRRPSSRAFHHRQSGGRLRILGLKPRGSRSATVGISFVPDTPEAASAASGTALCLRSGRGTDRT